MNGKKARAIRKSLRVLAKGIVPRNMYRNTKGKYVALDTEAKGKIREPPVAPKKSTKEVVAEAAFGQEEET